MYLVVRLMLCKVGSIYSRRGVGGGRSLGGGPFGLLRPYGRLLRQNPMVAITHQRSVSDYLIGGRRESAEVLWARVFFPESPSSATDRTSALGLLQRTRSSFSDIALALHFNLD